MAAYTYQKSFKLRSEYSEDVTVKKENNRDALTLTFSHSASSVSHALL